MTEPAIAATSSATPLATLLASTAKPPSLADYRSVLTPRELDAPAVEIEALTSSAAVHDLGWLKRVAVRGEDRFRWLSGMVTNTVKEMPSNTGAWNLVLTAQGRIQGDLTVWREEDNLELVIAADQYDRLIAHFEHFIIMDDVELVLLGQEPGAGETALGVTGPKVAEVLARIGLPTLPEPMSCTRVEWNGLDLRVLRGYGLLAEHYEIWTPAAVLKHLWQALTTGGATPVGFAMLDAFRIAEGIPAYGIDMVERDLPQETSQTRALHFNKGCYLGQEIVERIRSRGNVHRHLRSLELSGPLPPPGTELKLEAEQAGQITSAVELPLAAGTRIFALGMIRAEAEVRSEPLTYAAETGAGTARILTEPPIICS